MVDEKVRLIMGSLLHDTGKVIYRQGDDRRNHSISGYDYLKEETNCFQETNLNSEFYQQYLKENQIERYELEACGHEIVIPKGKHSLHLPFFQTNTAQFCTLYAKCACGDRGRQKSVEQCPGYCRGLVFLYPRHLEMFGKYNTLFGYDRTSLEEMEYLNQSVRQGIDRIVVNLL